jgi:hypothetical protein
MSNEDGRLSLPPEAHQEATLTYARAMFALAEKDVVGVSTLMRAIIQNDDGIRRQINTDLASRAHQISLGQSTLAEEIQSNQNQLAQIVGDPNVGMEDLIGLRQAVFQKMEELKRLKETQGPELQTSEKTRSKLSADILQVRKISSGLDELFSQTGDIPLSNVWMEFFRESARLFILKATGKLFIVDDSEQKPTPAPTGPNRIDQSRSFLQASRTAVSNIPSRPELRPTLTPGEITYEKSKTAIDPVEPASAYIEETLNACDIDPELVKEAGINLGSLAKTVTSYLKRRNIELSQKNKETHLRALICGTEDISLDEAFAHFNAKPGKTMIQKLQEIYRKEQDRLEELTKPIPENKGIPELTQPTQTTVSENNLTTNETKQSIEQRRRNEFPALRAILTTDEKKRFIVDGTDKLRLGYFKNIREKATEKKKGVQGSSRGRILGEESRARAALEQELETILILADKYNSKTINDLLLRAKIEIPYEIQKMIRWAELADFPPASIVHIKAIASSNLSIRPANVTELKELIRKRFQEE